MSMRQNILEWNCFIRTFSGGQRTRAGETDHGPYRAREVGMVYRVIPRGAWETGTGLKEIFGVVDECDIAYWPNPPLPLSPNTVEGHSVRPVIDAVDQVLRQVPTR
jgi:hypothetical protein